MEPTDVLQVISYKISSKLGLGPGIDEPLEGMEIALFKIRIPRVLAAIMVGAMLSLSGRFIRDL